MSRVILGNLDTSELIKVNKFLDGTLLFKNGIRTIVKSKRSLLSNNSFEKLLLMILIVKYALEKISISNVH